MLITICNLSYYNLYHIIMCFVKINHQSINQKYCVVSFDPNKIYTH